MRKFIVGLMIAVSFFLGMFSQNLIPGKANAASQPRVISSYYSQIPDSHLYAWKGFFSIKVDSKIVRLGVSGDGKTAFIYIAH